MRIWHQSFVVFVGVPLLSLISFGQVTAAAPATVGHGAFPVKVSKTLDSSKLKQDDSIEVETAGSFKLADGTLVPKGSKLEGRVVASKARSKGDPDSELTLAFTKLDISGGKQMSINGAVQAIYPPADEPMGPNMATAGASAGGSARGAGGDATGVTNVKSGMDTQSSSSGQMVMDMKATGVQGLHELSLDYGVISSKGKNVKLGTGVRMVVKVDILG